ncbi:hypothetical protein J2T57_001298 [Natronocella acetinitrilica]|uniref:Uncharacterized protein n=1 Tax=Natronocella acetinitrilica TaxID=414046 RepID=A0AAE3KB38_9GAMM|nr:hypothetical protein [Natronocella acetinitrilica]MCP1674196.1 hypothetical protein [Natronocella acetinitrilica]
MPEYTAAPIRLLEIANRLDTDMLAADANPDGYAWDDLIQWFSKHEVSANKDGRAYVPAILKDPSAWQRTRLTPNAARAKASNLRFALGHVVREKRGAPKVIEAIRELLQTHPKEYFERQVADVIRRTYAADQMQGHMSLAENARRLVGPVATTLDVTDRAVFETLREVIERTDEPQYRNDENVEAITMIVLDLDKPGAIDVAREVFADFDYIVHSTHSYSQATPHKFRMLLRPEAPISADDWRQAFDCLAAAVEVDTQCKNRSRLYYFPSIAPDAGIRPHWELNKGRPITLEAIHAIGRDHGFDPAKAAAMASAARAPRAGEPLPGDALVRDYTGALRKASERSRVFSAMRYQDYLAYHADALSALRDSDSRHGFALSVTQREANRFGPAMNFHRVVEFIFRASLEFSSRSALDGNTAEELPELIETALVKAGHETLDPSISALIQDAVDSAIVAERDGEWLLDQPGEEPPLTDALAALYAEYDYGALRERHSEALAAFAKDSKETRIANFATRVLADEHRRTPGRLDLPALAEFIYRNALDHVAKSSPEWLRPPRLVATLDIIDGRLCAAGILPVTGRARERYQVEWEKSLARARTSALDSHRWQYTANPLPDTLSLSA